MCEDDCELTLPRLLFRVFFLIFFMYNLHEQKTFSLVVNSFGFSPDDDDV